jgi:hypothetical protein
MVRIAPPFFPAVGEQRGVHEAAISNRGSREQEVKK